MYAKTNYILKQIQLQFHTHPSKQKSDRRVMKTSNWSEAQEKNKTAAFYKPEFEEARI